MIGTLRAKLSDRRSSRPRAALAFLALVLLAWQFVGIAHAVDLEAHAGKLSCHLCQVHDRDSSSPPSESRWLLLDGAFEHPDSSVTLPQVGPDQPAPTARGPPARSRRAR